MQFLPLPDSPYIIPVSATMSSDSAYAAAPFDHAKADVILRSSDNIDFRVFKLFLSLSSSFFEILFGIPQPAQGSEGQEIKDGLIVVPVTEDSKTLDALLRFCYPCTLADDPNLEVLEDVLDVLQAAKKYSLDVIEKRVARTFSNPKVLEAEPLRCFALARQRQMQEETLLAAKYTLTQPLLPSWFKEINLITASDLLALLNYHRECGDAVYALRGDVSWIKSHYRTSQACVWISGRSTTGTPPPNTNIFTHLPQSNGSPSCSCPRSLTPRYKLFESYSFQWWEDFMKEMFTVLWEKPCGATVASLAAKTVQSVKDLNCASCSSRITEGMRDFSELLTRKVEEEVSQIRLDLDLSVPSNKIQSDPKKGKKRR
ncbi:hypothetical protein J3R82DRAFT_2565 [Butyriboletus roseoflavus]|nr:hypothetical protein J3R82DRAFT_2565 [Butyriboletus roseoflavus]